MPNPNMVIKINRTSSEFIDKGSLTLSRFIFRNTFDIFFIVYYQKKPV